MKCWVTGGNMSGFESTFIVSVGQGMSSPVISKVKLGSILNSFFFFFYLKPFLEQAEVNQNTEQISK